MKLPNPNSSQPFDSVTKDVHGNEEYGYRTVDGLEEVIHIPSGRSNMQYLQPEKVTHYEGCNHSFRFLSVGKREIECEMCHFTISFHPIDFREANSRGYVRINRVEYPVFL